jgi:filamentous hemagglutinin family protein
MKTVEFTKPCLALLKTKFLYLRLLLGLGVWGFIATSPAIAQIVEDNTLSNERSVVTSVDNIRGSPVELIQGGATRGANLFHSFQEFNVNDGQRVYFANPNGIENILSRITGHHVSNILGTLGVDGGANLFLLNPNGIIFGQNARLDIAGSFVGSTANRFVFPDGSEFSATNPQTAQLLKINLTPGLQYEKNPVVDIVNQGNLTVGQNLTLVGNNLNLQGQLLAGKDLNLQAQDTLRIRDSAVTPFIAASGKQMLVQGNQAIDILALNHPQSGLFSSGDMILQSTNPVGGDAHFWSGGSFRIEQLNGNLGNLWSPNDPIIRANGNVSFDTYTGASLHIFAGGSVNLGSATINGTNTSDFINETVTLSDGVTTVAVNGSRQPTLDVRAGTTAIGSPLGLTDSPTPTGLSFVSNPTPTADINIGRVRVTQPNGLVFLTNQYQPNAVTSGAIQVGTILTNDNRGTVFSGNSGDIFINSRGDIRLPILGRINTVSTTGNAGDIHLIAGANISLANGAFIRSGTDGRGRGGDINIYACTLSLMGGAGITTNTFGSGRGGNLNINTSESVQLTGTSNLQAGTVGSGDAGNLTLNTRQLTLLDGSQLMISSFGTGLGGNLTIKASEFVDFSGISADKTLVSGLFADSKGTGNGGDVRIETGKLIVRDGAKISLGAVSAGKGGNLTVRATDSVEVSGTSDKWRSNINSETEGSGSGGNLAIATRRLIVRDGAFVSTGTYGQGQGGDLTIRASDSVELTGIDGQFETSLTSEVGEFGTGQGGNLTIQTRKFVARNGGNAQTTNFGEGRAGNLSVNASESVELIGTELQDEGYRTSSGLFTSTQGSQPSGDLTITTKKLIVQDGGQASASTYGSGRAGDLTVNASELVKITGTSPDGEFSSWLKTRSDAINLFGLRATGDAGNLTINTQQLILQDGGQLSVSTAADGNGGNLTVNAFDSVDISVIASVKSPLGFFRPSAIFAQVVEGATGNGGNIEVNTRSLSIKDGGNISTATSAQGDAGSVKINATNGISLDGVGGDGVSSGIFSSVSADAIGHGGNIDIKTPLLSVNNGAGIGVNSEGTGRGGNIQLQAGSLTLDNNTFVSAETVSTLGGNINIDLNKLLLMRNSSRISTTAGNDQFGGNGGNITINSPFIVAVPKENNDITANAFTGNGGQVNITTNGIFGIQRQENPTNQSDITASSKFGVSGVVTINTPDTDPSRGLIELPSDIVDASGLINQDFCTRGEGSKFIIIGKGGIAPSPNEPQSADLPWDDLRLPPNIEPHSRKPSEQSAVPRSGVQKTESSKPETIVEAQGLLLTADGKVVLTAAPMKVTPQGVWLHPFDCQMLQDGS